MLIELASTFGRLPLLRSVSSASASTPPPCFFLPFCVFALPVDALFFLANHAMSSAVFEAAAAFSIALPGGGLVREPGVCGTGALPGVVAAPISSSAASPAFPAPFFLGTLCILYGLCSRCSGGRRL